MLLRPIHQIHKVIIINRRFTLLKNSLTHYWPITNGTMFDEKRMTHMCIKAIKPRLLMIDLAILIHRLV
jgi:hypothetical protein